MRSASVSNLLCFQTRLQLRCRRTRPFHYPKAVHVEGHLQGAHSLTSSMKNIAPCLYLPIPSLWAEWKLRGREIQLDCFSGTTEILHRHLLPWMARHTTKPKPPHRYFTQNRLKTDRVCVWFAWLETCSSLFSPNKLQQRATSQRWDMAVYRAFSKGNSDILEFVHITFIWDIQNSYFFGWPQGRSNW